MSELYIGTDLVDVERIKFSIENYQSKFIDRVFSSEEQKYCQSKSDPAVHFAGKFAAKEAAKKTLDLKFNMLDIEIKNINSKPEIIIPCNDYGFDVSISHDGDYAIAIVISRKTNSM